LFTITAFECEMIKIDFG